MKLNYKIYGKGEPLIILHGLLGSLDNWVTLAKKFAENYTVFTIDQRNHGKSPHSQEFSYEVLREDLLEFMQDNYIHKANLLGHSMGGKTVMNFALEYPDMVNKLVVADIAPIKYKAGHKPIFDALFSVNLKNCTSRKDVDEQLSKYIKNFGIRQFLMKGLSRNKEGNFSWKFNLESIWNSYNKVIDSLEEDLQFEGETLFVKGENSNYIIEEYLPEIEKHFPNYKLKTIKNAGHWLHAEKPMEFYEIVREFLK